MAYKELLKEKEWHQKCQEILNRDKFVCQDCGCLGFHNESGYLVLDNVYCLDYVLDRWQLQGKGISKFIDDIPEFRLENLGNIKYIDDSEGIEELYHKIRLCKQSKEGTNYFKSRFHFPDAEIICNQDVDSLSGKGTVLFSQIEINDINIESSWIDAFVFNQSLSNKVFLYFHGCNYSFNNKYVNSKYILGLTIENVFLRFTIFTRSIVYRGLNVHHQYYVQGLKPWEYPDDALITLCEDCHKKRHQESTISVYNSNRKYLDALSPCPKCGGSGYLPKYHHIENGICFQCGGEGVAFETLDSLHS